MAENPDALEADEPNDEDIQDSFLKGDEKDQQRIASALGRSLKQQGEILKSLESFKSVAQKVEDLEASLSAPPQSQPTPNPDMTQLNEDLANKFYNGNVIEMLDTYYNLRTEADKSISQANMGKVSQLISGLKEEPFYNELAKPIQDMAVKYVQGGKDPETAVELAYNKVSRNHLAGLVATVHQHDPKILEVAKGGGSPSKGETKKPQLPSNFKAAMERDVKKGLYKDEKEWIANLAPSIRQQLGV